MCVYSIELHVLGDYDIIRHAYPILSPHLGRVSLQQWHHGRRGRGGAGGAAGGKAAVRGCQLEPLLELMTGGSPNPILW